MNGNRRAHSPLLASPQGGVAERPKNIAKHPLIAKPGWFSERNKRKTTPSACVAVAMRNFLMTQPPLLAVMQGGDYVRVDSNGFIPECTPEECKCLSGTAL